MEQRKKVFMIGPGFIGWNILDLLVEEGYAVTALTRRQQHADEIAKSGATPVMGSLSDLSLIQSNAATSDIVYQCATGDNLPMVDAILAGVRERAGQGKKTIYVHTSGAKVMADGARGMYRSDRIYTDADRSDVDSVADDAPHRDVDSALVQAQDELQDALKIAIVLPPEVYGYDFKHRRLSMLCPNMVRFTLKHGYLPMFGKGLSIETPIHVLDLARGYVAILHYLENAAKAEVLSNPYWFCENGTEFSWKQVVDAIGKALYDAQLLNDTTPKEPPTELWGELCGEKTPVYMGLNCRARAVRLRKLGWKATEKGFFESLLDDELPIILKERDVVSRK